MKPVNRITPWIAASLLALAGASSQAQDAVGICGGLGNSFGPFDYRDHAGSQDFKVNSNNPLRLVHTAHFRPEMEMLIRGGQGEKSDVGPEFDYTLRAFPNHHRALMALVRLSDKQQGAEKPKGMRYTVDCWFTRALQWRPDDVMVRMIYASYLGSRNRNNDAMEQLKVATSLAKDNALTHNNIGLIYFDLKAYDKALEQDHRATELGLARPTLRERLTAIGRWQEPGAAPASAASAAASAASN